MTSSIYLLLFRARGWPGLEVLPPRLIYGSDRYFTEPVSSLWLVFPWEGSRRLMLGWSGSKRNPVSYLNMVLTESGLPGHPFR